MVSKDIEVELSWRGLLYFGGRLVEGVVAVVHNLEWMARHFADRAIDSVTMGAALLLSAFFHDLFRDADSQ